MSELEHLLKVLEDEASTIGHTRPITPRILYDRIKQAIDNKEKEDSEIDKYQEDQEDERKSIR